MPPNAETEACSEPDSQVNDNVVWVQGQVPQILGQRSSLNNRECDSVHPSASYI